MMFDMSVCPFLMGYNNIPQAYFIMNDVYWPQTCGAEINLAKVTGCQLIKQDRATREFYTEQ